MSRIDALETEADRRRADFIGSLRRLKRKLTPLGLADAGLRQLDPEGQALTAVGQSLRQNPLPVVPLLLGLGWLALNVKKPSKPVKLKRRRGRSLIASQKKERHDEDDQKTQSNQDRTQDRQNHGHTVP
ncbi:MAG: hypothetical protein AB7F74_03620 [Parvibaculaceae bacterium]